MSFDGANDSGSGSKSALWSPAMFVRAGLVLMLLAGSGVVRMWQVRRVDAALAAGRESPFPLATVPQKFGDWTGVTTELDPRIVEATGSTDHITRRYVDSRTGVAIDVIILYGPTSNIFIHTPELCYPKAGYAERGESYARDIRIPGGTAPFRSLEYTKGETGQLEYQEVYYSWRYNGRWSPAVGNLKQSERIPGMYKVQLARRVGPYESRTIDNPCERLLEQLLPDLESRITGQSAPPAPADKT